MTPLKAKPPTSDKIAIFDVDGVLLDMWTPMHKMFETFFNRSVSSQEWVEILRDFDQNPAPYFEFGKHFMHSEQFRTLQPLPGMVRLLQSMKKCGWDLTIVTAAATDEGVYHNRRQNLNETFGDIFQGIHCVGSVNKRPIIQEYVNQYKQTLFCDDHPGTVQSVSDIVTVPVWRHNITLGYRAHELDLSKVQVAHTPSDIARAATYTEHSRTTITKHMPMVLPEMTDTDKGLLHPAVKFVTRYSGKNPTQMSIYRAR